MDTKSLFEKINKLSAGKKAKYLAIIIIIAIILAIYFSSFTPAETTKEQQPEDQTQTERDLADQLSNTLSKVEGAGRVEVVINYESDGSLVPALTTEEQNTVSNADGNTSKTTSKKQSPVTVQGSNGGDAVIIETLAPKVRGVVVVAQGADDIGVKMDLLNAVSTLLDVPVSKVEVLKMNKND